jgi:superfamily I DNA and/or RNA helicase/very-short-patch-repair endonuclease
MSNSGDEFTKKVIEKYRVQLLDLSKRNNLISFKHTNRSTKQIRIIDEVITTLFDKLSSEEELGFQSIELPDNIPEDEKNETFEQKLKEMRLTDEEFQVKKNSLGEEPSEREYLQLDLWLRDKARKELGLKQINRTQTATIEEQAKKFKIDPSYDLKFESKAKKHIDNYIQTLLYPDQLERRLKSIYDQSRLYESEAGINVLYAAFGFLDWYETDTSTDKITTPLILVPISIKREMKKGEYQYQIALRDDDISHNLCLEEKLKQNFGLQLPSFKGELTSYLSEVAELVKNKANWRIKNYVTIGFFAFSKVSMYRDLSPDKWSGTKFDETSLIFSLINGKDQSDILFAEDYDIDKKKLIDEIPLTITDADSSQISAIYDVLQGKDLVIEGPPGTGKSQTITNIIASALEKEKRVLFISEKKAALDVVKNRLDKAGLGVFCLELHSSKTKRSEVASSIEESLSLRTKKKSTCNLQQEVEYVELIKKKIQNYINSIHSKYEPLERSFQNIIWIYLKLASSELPFSKSIENTRIENYASIDSQSLTNIKSEIRKFIQYAKDSNVEVESYFSHIWRPFTTGKISAQNAQDFLNHQAEIVKALANFYEEYGYTKIFSESLNELTVAEALKIQTFLEMNKSIGIDQIDLSTFIKIQNEKLVKDLKSYIENEDKIFELNRNLTSFLQTPNSESIFLLMSEDLGSIQNLDEIRSLSLNAVESELRKNEAIDKEVNENIESLKRAMTSIGLKAPLTKKEFGELSLFSSDIAKIPDYVFGHRNKGVCAYNSKALVSDLKNFHKELSELRNTISLSLRDFCFTVTSEEVGKAIHEFRNYSIFSWFKSSFRKARRLYRSLYTGSNFSYQYSANNLELLLKYHSQYANYISSPSYKALVGEKNPGLDVPVDEIENTVNLINEFKFKYPEHEVYTGNLQNLIVNEDNQSLERSKRLMSHPSFKSSIETILAQMTFFQCDSFEKLIELLKRKKSNLLRFQNFDAKYNLKSTLTISQVYDLQSLLNNCAVRENTRATYRATIPLSLKESNLAVLKHTIGVYEIISTSEIPSSLKKFVFSQTSIDSIKFIFEVLPNLKNVTTRAQNELDSLYVKWGLSSHSLFGKEDYNKISVQHMLTSFLGLNAKKNTLIPYIQLKESEDYLVKHGLKSFLRDFTQEKIPFSHFENLFMYSLYGTILQDFFNSNYDLKKNAGVSLTELRKLFCEQDKKLIELQRQQLKAKLLKNDVVDGNSKGKVREYTEMGFINHQISLQRGHAPIRDYFSRAFYSIMAIKPCLMMSPMSISQYLPSEDFYFDLVVMDEASQLKPEDALGAILRAKQVVVVGDPKQLPPTNFFNFSSDASNEDENDEVDLPDYESILDMALKSFRPARRLKWHYRSRHENLISFSNKSFYDDDLVIFPSPHYDDEEYGLHFRYLEDGVYQGRKNLIEAQEIVKYVADHVQKYPDKSLGIVTINQAQQELVNDLIDMEMRNNVLLQDYLTRHENSLEPLIIKNLENIQGDERDVILISTVYGKEPGATKFHQRFGPINGKFGHRRLNVLFTRARYKTLVFSSLDPDNIVAEDSSSVGLKAFKNFLSFAKNKKISSVTSTGEADSDFEVFVMKAIEEAGFVVHSQIGVSGYRIDLGIVHPKHPGKYLLGIECDGATYHSSKSARDRDKIRQEILESLGWKIYRIWSTDWFNDPQKEIAKLIDEIKKIA